MNNKLSVLHRISSELNNIGALWALGGSAMLYLRGMVDDFHDIDIIIASSSVASVSTCMDSIATRLVTVPNASFNSQQFAQYYMDGIGIDIICDFGIVCDGITHSYDWCDSDVDSTAVLHGTNIPLHSLSVWRQFYMLMGRHSKVQLIDSATTTD